MDNANIICIDMPTTIKAYTCCNDDGSYTIVLNSALCFEQQRKSYLHEIEHIKNGDFERTLPAGMLEFYAHTD